MSSLISKEGRPQWGRLSALPDDINWQDFDARDAMGRKRSPWMKNWLFKHFDFYGVQGKDFTFGCGLVRLGLLNSAFVYLFSEKTGLVHRQVDLPLSLGLHAEIRPLGTTRWANPFNKQQSVTSARQIDGRQLLFNWEEGFSGSVELDCRHAPTLAMNTPIANTGFAYAQKTSGVPVSGTIVCEGEVFTLDPEHDGCYHDWTAGFLRRETFWNWACATGRLGLTGPLASINLARGVNETSAHENVIWLDGHMHDLPLTHFEYDRDDVTKPWKVFSQCGTVQLEFTPKGQISDHRNVLVVASRFNQCFGEFNGQVRVDDRIIQIKKLKGWCEDHYAKW